MPDRDAPARGSPKIQSFEEQRSATAGPLAELAEVDAPPAIKAIYADIKRLTGVPMVALIFRHLATRPGALEDAWRVLSPAFVSGRIQSVAWWLAEDAECGPIVPALAPATRLALGIDAAGEAAVSMTLDAYNRANPVNMLAMLSLMERHRLGAAPARPLASEAAMWSAPAPITGPLPRMTPVGEIAPDLRHLINDLGFGDRSELDSVVPSLYRHFTPWPALLGLLHATAGPAFRDGSLAFKVETLHDQMRAKAAEIAPTLAPLEHGDGIAAALPTLRRFTSSVIPQMVLVGFALKTALAG
ncbi:MAG TPA: hypothetical protein PK264_11455 [Hyphomicrobiaceae bacterium]|nr:hypothetical protein [Hyphomicrobiaceae bacterium]